MCGGDSKGLIQETAPNFVGDATDLDSACQKSGKQLHLWNTGTILSSAI